MAEDLNRAWMEARAAWPGVDISEPEFVAFVSERMRAAGSETEGVTLQTTDLYLACSCARGDPAALQAFEHAYFPEIDRALKKMRSDALPERDELAQLLRYKLFVADGEQRPKIGDYSGRGSLRGWFRVTTSRLLLNLATRAPRETPFEHELLDKLLGGTADPELEHARRQLQTQFRAAFADAYSALDARERSLLRYAIGEDLTVQAIGTLFGVHKTTAARWVVAAHRALLDALKSSLVARLGIQTDDYASVLRALRSRLELSLDRYLDEPA